MIAADERVLANQDIARVRVLETSHNVLTQLGESHKFAVCYKCGTAQFVHTEYSKSVCGYCGDWFATGGN